jgi:hypothetical protein
MLLTFSHCSHIYEDPVIPVTTALLMPESQRMEEFVHDCPDGLVT